MPTSASSMSRAAVKLHGPRYPSCPSRRDSRIPKQPKRVPHPRPRRLKTKPIVQPPLLKTQHLTSWRPSSSRGGATDGIKAATDVEVAIVQRNPDRVTRRPRELLVKVRLPGVTSAAGVDVDVDGAAKSVKVDHPEADLHAKVSLPFPVDGDAGSAQFDTEMSLLTLTLPVVAPKVEEKDALQHLESNVEADAHAVNDKKEAMSGAQGDGSENTVEEHVMVREQRTGRIAMPRKLCSGNMLF